MLGPLVDSENVVMSKNRPGQYVHRAFNQVGKTDIKKKKVKYIFRNKYCVGRECSPMKNLGQ